MKFFVSFKIDFNTSTFRKILQFCEIKVVFDLEKTLDMLNATIIILSYLPTTSFHKRLLNFKMLMIKIVISQLKY